MNDTTCPLCESERRALYQRGKDREYWRCGDCGLIGVPRRFHASEAACRDRYDQHRNSVDDPGYCTFLVRLIDPLAARLPPGASGLDFGSGPGPALALLMGRRGFPMVNYDPLYADDRSLLTGSYDFVTCTETVEHFAEPRREWDRLIGLVAPGGWLGVMTERVEEGRDLTRWRYGMDFTHVAFYAEATFTWLSRHYGLGLEIIDRSAVLMRKG